MDAPKMNLYQKLLEIQKHVNGLGKDSRGNNYEYVSGAKVLAQIKPKMNELGVLLKQEVISVDNVRQDYSTKSNPNKSEILSKVMMRFTWVDCETKEMDESLFAANGQNDWDKGVGSALTYGERYFLLKFFHIATDEDDIDSPYSKKKEVEVIQKPKMTEDQKTEIIRQSSLTSSFTPEESKKMLEWVAKEQTFENAERTINRNNALITERSK